MSLKFHYSMYNMCVHIRAAQRNTVHSVVKVILFSLTIYIGYYYYYYYY